MPLRSVSMQPNFLRSAPSCLIECGGTRVLCTATVAENVPPFLRDSGQGWLTAEYAMLPASTQARKPRDGIKRDGRGVEIGRLIGRSLRQAIDLSMLGERTITVDCDVLEADGGTRTASITGGYIALALAVDELMRLGKLDASPLIRQIAAVSVGMVAGKPVLDLCYEQDAQAEVDMNIVMDGMGNYIEVQGTGEGGGFSRHSLQAMMDLATGGIGVLLEKQRSVLYAASKSVKQRKTKLLVATNNSHKLHEIQEILGQAFEIVSLRQAGLSVEVEETGDTFAENAILKAEALQKMTVMPVLADDSGLVVEGLGGEPGVYSARYAGSHGDDEANNRLLLSKLMESGAKRDAEFVCAMALSRPGRETIVVEGRVSGHIIDTPRGTDGFGYDPLFEHANGMTFAEMPAKLKNSLSHRKLAAEMLEKALLAEKSC